MNLETDAATAMNPTDTAAIEANHRQQAQVLRRPVFRSVCPSCGGTKTIDCYVGDRYAPQHCGRCDQSGFIDYSAAPG